MNKNLSKFMSVVLAGSMVLSTAGSVYAANGAHTTDEVTSLETTNSNVSSEAAREGMVLLENNGALPMASSGKVALFGTGAYATIKGGTGSGDVNQRDTVTVWQGFKNAGYDVVNEEYLQRAYDDYVEKKAAFVSPTGNRWESYKHVDTATSEDIQAAADADTAIYVISTNSGEGDDRTIGEGDYYLFDQDRANLEEIAKTYENVIVLLNVGGVIDTKFYDEINAEIPDGIDAMLLMSQGGQNTGDVVVEVLNGTVTPSGKTVDTWAENYTDYPAGTTIGAADGQAYEEDYSEGIYVGYRYFDTFNKEVAYPFGYGLSYTDFDIDVVSTTATADNVSVTAKVTNTGDTYSGKEVVEVYFSAPDGVTEKPYQELAGYVKTDELAPGESQMVTVNYVTTEMSSYDEASASYIMDAGDYVVRVGNSSRNTEVAAVLTLDEAVTTEQLSNQLTTEDNEGFEELSKEGVQPYSYTGEAEEIAAADKIALDFSEYETVNNASDYDDETITTYLTEEDAATYTPAENEKVEVVTTKKDAKLIDVYNGDITMQQFVAGLSVTQMANIVNGTSGSISSGESSVAADANSVQGAAGETTSEYYDSLGIPNIVLADGPAGIRITQSYTDEEQTYYQFCTAMPIGTMLAQTWNVDLIKEVGEAIGSEMSEYGVTLWLAPGMNIHRDPLNGRNFEYFSEDPLVTGQCGAAETAGVQSNPGIGVTIKHYATNNQEINRNTENNTISERALREIYLKGFEITVKEAQPMAIMCSYNLINETYAAENYDLLEDIPRGEWGFKGLVMTDWGCVSRSAVSTMLHAGLDLIMPGRGQQRIVDSYNGTPQDYTVTRDVTGDGVAEAVQHSDGTVILGDLQKATIRVLNIIMQSTQFAEMNGTENVSYTETYADELSDYVYTEKDEVVSAKVTSLEKQIEELKAEAAELQEKNGELTDEVAALYEKVVKLQSELKEDQLAESSEREARNAQLSKEAAEDGIVLLENNDETLPVKAGTSVAMFGTATYGYVKGGTGSGDVYNKYTITTYDGLESSYTISNQEWWDNYLINWEAKKAQAASEKASNDYVTYKAGSFGGAASYLPIDQALTQADMDAAKANGTTTAFYSICRISGEGADRAIEKGEYYLSDVEEANLKLINENFDKVIVLLNVGGIVDTKFFTEINGLDALVLVSQAGMEGGNAIADILTGAVTPSGKLTDTWAVNYKDYPGSDYIANHNGFDEDGNVITGGDTTQEDYKEGIYVGYRYFDSFNITPAYEFGFGGSYTDFDIDVTSVKADADQVTVKANVTNTGDTYSGKEVVEVYFSAPSGEIDTPYQELAGYAKTDTLAPGESQELTISYDTTDMSSYNMDKAAYVMQAGDYIIRVGNSSRNTSVAAVLTLGEDTITEQLSNQLVNDDDWDDLSSEGATSYSYAEEAAQIAAADRIALDFTGYVAPTTLAADEDEVITYMTAEKAATYTAAENEKVVIVDDATGSKLIDVYNGDVTLEEFVAQLTNRQLSNLVNGISGANASFSEGSWGSEANSVKGAAGETTSFYGSTLGIPNTVEADGPAGIRITAQTTDEDGNVVNKNATAFPIGTLLAQTWNVDIINKVGAAIGEEMYEFGVTLWLAPGMNIHRDAANGRNFEYYSEDPLVTGQTGAAITAGVQSNPGVGVTIKHYSMNNQETNRNGNNVSVSERAAREIYLKGFEIVCKTANPMAIMSSYNYINGTYASENYDLLTAIPRNEWGWTGMVMTDWGAGSRSTVQGMMHAGNDLIMSGSQQLRIYYALEGNPLRNTSCDVSKMEAGDKLAAAGTALANGNQDSALILGDVQNCAMRVLKMIMSSNQFASMNGFAAAAYTTDYAPAVETSKAAVVTAEENALAAKVASLEEKLAALETEVAELKASSEATDAETKKAIEDAEATIANLKAQLEKADADAAASVEASVNALQAQIDALNAALAEANAKAADLEAKLAKAALVIKQLSFKTKTVKAPAVKGKKKAVTVTIKAVKGAQKYEIRYATSKSFKNAKTIATSKLTKTLKSLKSGRKYYVKVRALKNIGGKLIRTKFSSKISVKVK